MNKDMIQLSDGSWNYKSNCNQCDACEGWFLRDEAKERGEDGVICEGCAKEKNINYCEVCGRSIDYEFQGKLIKFCKNCKNRTTDFVKRRNMNRRRMRSVMETIPEDLRDIAVKLMRVGDLQKAGLLPFTDCRSRSWDLEEE